MTKYKQQAAPEFTTDADGQEVVHVPLANSQQQATLYAEDYRKLMAAGFSRFWKYVQDGCGRAYPTLNAYTSDGHNREVTIARLVAGAGRGQRVRAIDGNALNLRTENLEFFPGAVWFNASDWYPTAEALRAAGIEPAGKTPGPRRRHRRPEKPSENRTASAGAPVETKAGHSPATAPARPPLPATPAVVPSKPFTPRTINRAALSARVGVKVSEGLLENFTTNFREGIEQLKRG
ncbi:hypothetical protein [Frateuria defendens]|uniref:hypothetical protein n=1 Tax=Frateuria defendens TaxID=2219559 RepID=UPI001293A559|nr:hypothetical protein [Frateuria defendens]